MKNIDEIIENIEESFDVNKIKINGQNYWGIFRIAYFFQHVKRNIQYSKKSNRTIFSYFRIIKDLFYGFNNFFGTYNYFLFTDSSKKIKINEKYWDKSVDELNRNLGLDETLVFETPNHKHFKIKFLHNKNIVSLLPVILLTKIVYLLTKFNKVRISGRPIIESINQKFDKIKIDPEGEVKYFLARYWVYKKLLKIYRPKAIFVDTYVGRMALIKAANDLQIKTFEIQHGFVSDVDLIYHSNLKLDKSLYPLKLLCFGALQKKIFNNNRCQIEQENIIPIGKFFVKENDKKFLFIDSINKLKSQYHLLVGFTLQRIFIDKTYDFFNYVLPRMQNVGFILIVKQNSNYHKKFHSLSDENKNFYTHYENYNFDQIIKYLDIHSSVDSTCCLEAPAFEVPNLLIDIDGAATKHMGFLKEMTSTTQIAYNDKMYIKKIENILKIQEKKNFLDDKNLIIEPNYTENIKKLTQNFTT